MAIPHEKAAFTPKPATGLGKFEAKTAYLGDHAFSGGDPAKAGDRLGKIPGGTRLSWRFPQEKAAVTPKPATFDPLGKIPAEPVYHGDRETKRDPIGEPFRIGEPIRIGEAAKTRPTRSSKFRTTSFPADFEWNAV